MRQKILVSATILFFTSLLFLCSLSLATKSRLSGMGDLSIMIEDESNMINLWDFARNPAGFLADEKRSVIRGDFLWDTYQIKNLRHYDYSHPSGYIKYNADADMFDNRISGSFRREDDFALGAEGNYLSRETDSKYEKQEQTSPKILLVFSKNVNSHASFGANLSYIEDNWEYLSKTSDSKDQQGTKNLRAEIGVGRKFSSGVIVGALLGYDSFEPDEDIYLSDSYSIWLSGQTMVEIEDKLKLGMETIFKFQRADFGGGYDETGKKKKEDYYSTCLRFRGIYDLSSEFRLGLFFFDNEPFTGFYDPIYSSFPFPPYEYTVRHFGGGCSYKFNRNILGGVEYHFRDFSWPSSSYSYLGLKSESLNLGVEGRLSEALSLRGGFIRTETNQNPNYDKQRDTWENTFTLGFGYEPYEWNLIIEFSYGFVFKKFKQWYTDWDVESEKHIFSLSLKKVL